MGASVDPEEHPEMETLGFINRSVELPYMQITAGCYILFISNS